MTPTSQPAQRIYWHRDLPPLDLELMGEHVVEAASDPVAWRFDQRDALWAQCSGSLRARLTERLDAEITRLGGACAHVLEEEVTPQEHHDTATFRLVTRVRYTLYRARS